MNKFVILDRDGVINKDSDSYIKNLEEWIPEEGSIEAIVRLTKANIPVFVATNQSGIGRGKISIADLKEIHHEMSNTVEKAGGAILDIKFCPHHPNDRCECRKPEIGLITQILSENNLKASDGYFVGDSDSDLQAADKSGCKAVLVLTGKGRTTLINKPKYLPVFPNLLSFVMSLLENGE
ncbi:MAG: D-glycero-beta-D-manno-heptose-1,7-bisphosphate 7-phosphatase [Gammaproteobacteria bacterium]|nr:D-glycero-beta-D-manno-heptose-1,7-bisphosphate 7-phosphatase [Gammaproteobacteria bacterium]|tara:strand:+ start:1310 stop:1849 length:540 start_codon:yes stop_codon:yes gene_type:complete